MQIMVLSRKCFKDLIKAQSHPANLLCGAVLIQHDDTEDQYTTNEWHPKLGAF